MALLLLLASLIGAWLVVEVRVSNAWIRIASGLIAISSVACVVYGLCMLGSEFNCTFQTNTVTKNLTAGLEHIVTKTSDLAELRFYIKELNESVSPTYEDHQSAKNAIANFLLKYDIKYRDVFPSKNNPVTTRSFNTVEETKPAESDGEMER